jgi:L-serine deaminase
MRYLWAWKVNRQRVSVIDTNADTQSIPKRIKDIYELETLKLNGEHVIKFNPTKHLIFHFAEYLPSHPNGMRFSCYDKQGDMIATNEYYSIGGGFVVNDQLRMNNVYFKDERVDHVTKIEPTPEAKEEAKAELDSIKDSQVDTHSKHTSSFITAALPFYDADSLLKLCHKENLSIAQVVFKNELQWRTAEEITSRTLNIWNVMNQSIMNGILSTEIFLPGQLKVKRRSPGLHRRLTQSLADFAGFSTLPTNETIVRPSSNPNTPSTHVQIRPKRKHLPALDYLSLYAIAVNEENAAGGRVVTAPTNGAAGTIPAVLKYYLEFICPNEQQKPHDIVEFLLTAAAIGMLYKRGASISAGTFN